MTVCTCNPRTGGRGCGDSGMTEVAGQPTWPTVSPEVRERETLSGGRAGGGKGGYRVESDSGRHLKSNSGLHTGTHGCKHLYTHRCVHTCTHTHAPHTANMCSAHTHTHKDKMF